MAAIKPSNNFEEVKVFQQEEYIGDISDLPKIYDSELKRKGYCFYIYGIIPPLDIFLGEAHVFVREYMCKCVDEKIEEFKNKLWKNKEEFAILATIGETPEIVVKKEKEEILKRLKIGAKQTKLNFFA